MAAPWAGRLGKPAQGGVRNSSFTGHLVRASRGAGFSSSSKAGRQSKKEAAGWTELDVYTDGNHFKHIGGGSGEVKRGIATNAMAMKARRIAMGYGAYAAHRGRHYGLMQRVDAHHLERFFGMSPDLASSDMSNPAMELCAVAHVLWLCSQCFSVPSPSAPASSASAPSPSPSAASAAGGEGSNHSKRKRIVRIHTDYDGPRLWISGEWKAKAPHIKHLLSFCKQCMSRAAERGSIEVELVRVEGHSGNLGNDIADALSKGDMSSMMENLDKLFS